MFRVLTIAGVLAAATPAFANDTTAELKTGGLVFTRTDAVSIESEDLFISPEAVRVAYVFRNVTDEDVASVVAFPMPDIRFDPNEEIAMPESGADNFLGFTVNTDGKTIKPELQQRAIAAELDVTDDIIAAGIPVNPLRGDGLEQIDKLSDAIKAEWVSRGMLHVMEYDDGSGWKKEYYPGWTLRSAYWWRMTFPASRTIAVRHEYKPSVGGTVATTFVYDGKIGGDHYPAMKQKYCIDSDLERAVLSAARKNPDGNPPYVENWISYVLTTGANWAYSIGHYTLTIDKGDPGNLVSFCGNGVEKIGPTTFRVTYDDFVPERDIDILLLRRSDQ